MRIANLVTSGDFWTRISDDLVADAASRGVASVETYYVGIIGVRGTSSLSLTMTDLIHVDAGIRACDDGCDAVFVNATPDYGVPLLRAALPVPVIGAGEAAMLATRAFGERFSIVTIWPESYEPMYGRLLAQTGMADRCASVVYTLSDPELVARRDSVKTDMEAYETSLLDRIEQSCRRAFDEDDADSIVLGCTCMHPIAAELARRFDRPVLDPTIVGWRFAELTAQAAPVGGQPAAGAPREHRDAFRSLMSGALALSLASDCEVCEVVAEPVVGRAG
jgi:Asp/Glu/hydantoin racemase